MAAPRKPYGSRAEVRSGGDLVKGQFIEYDGMTENYLVTNGGGTWLSRHRVLVTGQAVIQPKGNGAPRTPRRCPRRRNNP